MYTPDIHSVARGTVIPKDIDEVNISPNESGDMPRRRDVHIHDSEKTRN